MIHDMQQQADSCGVLGILYEIGHAANAARYTPACGQSDNAFTPIQLALYMSTVVNGGTRYKTHRNIAYNVHLPQ